jgi:adenine-specific DNA-methyltransferase
VDDRYVPNLNLTEKNLPKGILAHLQKNRALLEPKPRDFDNNSWEGRKSGSYQWFETQDAIAYRDDFLKPKIIYPNMTKHLPFYYDSDEHFYTNDKAFIITSEAENLPALTAQLNSSLFRFCFKDNFPDLLGNSYELRKIFFDKIPLKRPNPEQARVFEVLVGWVQVGKRYDVSAFKTAFVESLIDACMLEMYFADEMARCNLAFLASIEAVLETAKTLEAFYDTANDSKHPLRNGLLRLPVESPDLFGLFLKEGRT